MFNDKLDVREGNEQRKRALARVAQKLLQNRGRSGGLAGLSGRAGGGLGRQNAARFRPLAQRNMGQFARLAPGGRDKMGLAIGRFGITERMPGAYDPAASVPDLGGAPSDVPGLGNGGTVPLMGPNTLPQPGSGSQLVTDPNNPDAGVRFEEGLPTYTTAPDGGDYSGYVMYQGQLIPIAVYKAMQASGDLF